MSIVLFSQDAELIGRCQRAVSAEHDVHVADTYAALQNIVTTMTASVVLLDSAVLANLERDVAVIAASLSSTRVIVMTPSFDADEEVALLKAGAKGCCRRGIDPESLQQVLGVANSGGVWVTRSLLPRLVLELHRYAAAHNAHVSAPPSRAPRANKLSELTVREREVVRLIVEGASNKEVAAALGISERTVKGHLSNIFQKLGVPDRLKLVVQMKHLDAAKEPGGN
jgi:two-component system NarL family response regulator